MSGPARRARALVWLFGALAFVVAPTSADACGGFYARTEERPSLSYEQTLILFDDQKGQEHFVREVVFTKGKEPFGFVVPTPGRPEVFPVKKSPFKALHERFPFSGPRYRGLRASGAGGMAGAVEVLEIKRVGSFTSFVLAASEPEAFAAWLKHEGFVSTKQSDAWLAHYVSLGFYFVAMRYEPPKGAPASNAPSALSAETIRISFPTPLAYYPYLEPEASPGTELVPARGLELWLVTRKRSLPVAARTTQSGIQWVRPLASGHSYGGFKENLAGALGELLPLVFDGSLFVQRFLDQKRSRSGFGDILFVPEAPGALPAAPRESLRALLPLFDPELTAKEKP